MLSRVTVNLKSGARAMRVSTQGATKVRRTFSTNGQNDLPLLGGAATIKTRDAAASGLRYEKSLSSLYLGGSNAI